MVSFVHALYGLALLVALIVVAVYITKASVEIGRIPGDRDEALKSAYAWTTTLAVLTWVAIGLMVLGAIVLIVIGIFFAPEILAALGLESATEVYVAGKVGGSYVKTGVSWLTYLLLGGLAVLTLGFGAVALRCILYMGDSTLDHSEENFSAAYHSLWIAFILSAIILVLPLIVMLTLAVSHHHTKHQALQQSETPVAAPASVTTPA